MLRFFSTIHRRLPVTPDTKTSLSEAVDEIKGLWSEKRYKEALSKVDQAECDYPEFSKLAKSYRGKISVDFLAKGDNDGASRGEEHLPLQPLKRT